jgi:hypothetical protein
MSNTRYVRKASSGSWEILKEGHRRATAHSRTRDGALKAARTAVRKEGGGEVVLMNRTGKVVGTDTVARPKSRAAA